MGSGSWNGPASTSNTVLYRVHANRTQSSNQITDPNTHAIPETDTLPFLTPLPNVRDGKKSLSVAIIDEFYTIDLLEIDVKNLQN